MTKEKYALEFETKREAGLMADKTSKYSKKELYEIFNESGDREEKIEVLKSIAGKSQSVIAPTKENPFESDLGSDDVVRDIYFDEVDDVEITVVPEGEISEGGKYWIMINDDNLVIHYREVSKQLYEFIEEKKDGVEYTAPPETDFEYSAGFGDGLTISGNRNKFVVFPVPDDFESTDYFSVKFGLLEKMVRIGRGGSYTKRWYQGKEIMHDGSVARVDTEKGFFIIAETQIQGYSDSKASLGEAVKLEDAGRLSGGATGITVVPTEKYSDYKELKEAVMSSDLNMQTFEVIDRLKDEGFNVERSIDVEMGKEELDQILDLDPEPLQVSEVLVKSLKGFNPDIEYDELLFTENVDSFTGADLEVYSPEGGDVKGIPKPDKSELNYDVYESVSYAEDKIEGIDTDWSITRIGDGWNISNGDMRIEASFDENGDFVLAGDAVETYIELNESAGRDLRYAEGDKLKGVGTYSAGDKILNIIEFLEDNTDEDMELKDSGESVDSVYSDYHNMVNMSPAEIEERINNDKCLNRASGSDAVEHLKRNKFILETNKSDWDSKKVPESFANGSAKSRKVVDQAVRTISFGERHLAQLENESITRSEDGCFNPRVEGLKNWAIDPLEKGFEVDEDKYENKLSDVEYSVKNVSGNSTLRDSDFSHSFGNVKTEVLVDRDSSKTIGAFSDVTSHLKQLDLGDNPQEQFMVVYLDGDNNHLGTEMVSKGGNDGVDFDEKAIIRTASVVNARAVIIAHNHPSGNSEPSDTDIQTTRKVKRELSEVGIDMLDHVIIGDTTMTSMAKNTSVF